MDMTNILLDIISLVHNFNIIGNVSMYSLLRQSGYFEVGSQVSKEMISDVLVQHPELLDEWIEYSEDKRSDHGWYIRRESDSTFKVGYRPNGDSELFSNGIDACAAFIKFECESINFGGKV
jgi:hypothetical protein